MPLNSDGGEGDRKQQEEGEPRRRVPIESEEAAGRDRDPRPRDTGHEREALREADGDALLQRQVVHRPRHRPAVGPAEEKAEPRQEDRDLPGLAHVLGDEVLEQEADHPRRDRRRDDHPRHPLLGRRDRATPQRAEPRDDETLQVVPEVRPDRDERPEVKRDVERLVEGVVRPRGSPTRRATGRG